MREAPFGQIGLLFWRRDPAEDGVTVWVTPEDGDHLPHFDRLFCGKLISRPQVRRRVGEHLLRQRDRSVQPIEMIGTLAVHERQIVDGSVPGRFQCVVMAVRIALERNREGFVIIGKGALRVAPDRAREWSSAMISARRP